MQEAIRKGNKIHFNDLLKIIKVRGGMSPLTYKRYVKDLQDFGFIEPGDRDYWKILRTKQGD